MNKTILFIFLILFSVFFINALEPEEIVISSSSTHDLYKQAESYYKKGQMQIAIKKLEMIIGIDPLYISAYYLLGRIYKENNDYSKALWYFERAIQVRKDISEKEKNLDEIENAPDIKEKINDVHKNEEQADELCNKAIKFVEEGDFFQAENTLKYAIELNPNLAEYHFRLADILIDEGKTVEANESLRKGLKLDRVNVHRIKMLAKLYYDDEKYSDSVRVLKDSMEINPYLNNMLRDDLTYYSKYIREDKKFIIIKRDGREIIINAGFRDGMKKGMEFRTHFTVYRGGSSVKDLNSGEILGTTDESIVGEILITKVDEKLTYGQVTMENNKKVRIGDFVKDL